MPILKYLIYSTASQSAHLQCSKNFFPFLIEYIHQMHGSKIILHRLIMGKKICLLFILLTCYIRAVSSWCLRTMFAGITSIQSVDFSPDGQYIVTGEISGRVLLWKRDTLEILKTYMFPYRLWEATFSKDQQRIAIAGQNDFIHIVSGSSLSFIMQIDTSHGKVYDVDYRYNSQEILTCGDDNKTKIWNASTGVKNDEVSNRNKPYTCQFADNSWFAVAGDYFVESDGYSNNNWVIVNANKIYQLHNHALSRFLCVRVKPSGDYLIAVNTNGDIYESVMNSSSTDATISGSSGGLYSCAYARDSSYFAVAGDDGNVYMFNATNRANTLQSILRTNSTSTLMSAQFSYDSNYFIAGDQNGTVYYYDRFCHGCPVGTYPNKTTCRKCVETMVGCAICINSTVCRSCMAGYYYSSSACKSCDVIEGCGNCNSSTNCSVCLTGFYKVGVTCVRCLTTQYGCEQCSGPTTCLECDKNSYLSGTTCIPCTTLTNCIYCNSSSYCLECRVGYYQNAGVCTVCQSAANPYCLICQTATNCSRCVSGYRVNSSNLCEKCLPECLFCNNTNHCFDCVEQMYVTTAFACAFCVHPCYTCNSSTYCLSCVASYYLSAAGVCTNCPAGCLSCNTSTRCQSCDVGFYLDSGTHLCNKCSQITANCRQCNTTTCLACEVDFFLNGAVCSGCSGLISNCMICDNATVCQLCMTGYYPTGLTGSSSCGLCEVGCTACKSATACTSCKQGYYISGQDCLLCSNRCLTCTSSAASACTSCIEGYYLSTATTGTCLACSTIPRCSACLNSTYCVGCNVGYFLSSPTTCTACTPSCTTCKTSATDCLTCDLGFYQSSSGGIGVCSACNPECSQCSTSASICLNCVQGYYHNPNTSQCIDCSLSLPGCSVCDNSTTCVFCSTGFYPLNFTCRSCSLSISKCLRCNVGGSTCSLCDYGFALSATNTSCVQCQSTIANCEHCISSSFCQTCKSMFYSNAGSCAPCAVGCMNCFNGSYCEICMDTYIMLANKTCQLCEDAMVGCQLCTSPTVCVDCVLGYYLGWSVCLTCRGAMEGCESCSDSTNCLHCNVFYQLQSNSTCSLCSLVYPDCQLCSNSTVGCLECQVGYFLNTSTGQCNWCSNVTSTGCLKCANDTTCTECMAGYYLNTTSNLCGMCDAAFFGCVYCTFTACLQCESGFYLNGASCSACPKEGCQVCYANDSNKCVGCNSRYYLVVDSCVLCSQAINQCQECETAAACTECASGFYLTPTYLCGLCSDLYPGCAVCSPSGCLDCMSNFFLNSTDLLCHNCTDYIAGCSFCLSESICISCQNGYYMVNNTCEHCTALVGCLYCTNSSRCTHCAESYYLAQNDSQCYRCVDVLPGCWACDSNTTCIGCYGNYELLAGECVEIKGEVLRDYPAIGIKSVYLNDSCLKHILFAREFQFTKIDQNWPNVSQLALISKNYTRYPLTILKVQWSATLTQLYFFTNNPIADQLSQSVKNMPFVKTARRLLQDTSTDLGFNLKFMLNEQATHDIMPKLAHLGDLYLDYPYSDPEFYESYLRNRPYYYFIFGLAITLVLLIGYTVKLCCLSPRSRDRGSIIPHIFALRCGALALYPTYAEYVNFCYGFMTADLPWLNSYFGSKLANANDVIPQSFAMYYTNLSMASTYFLALLAIAVVWFSVGLASYLCEPLKQRLEVYKSFLYNFFSLGAVMAGCLALQGVILNPIDSLTANTVLYIVGIVVYLSMLVEIVYSWSVSQHEALHRLKAKDGDDIGTAGHIGKLRGFIKATLLAVMHLGPLYFVSALFCFEGGMVIFEYFLARNQKESPKIQICEHILINLALLLLILVPDALVGIVVSCCITAFIIVLQSVRIFRQAKNEAEIQAYTIGNINKGGNSVNSKGLHLKSNESSIYSSDTQEIKNHDSISNLMAASIDSPAPPVLFRNRTRKGQNLQFRLKDLQPN